MSRGPATSGLAAYKPCQLAVGCWSRGRAQSGLYVHPGEDHRTFDCSVDQGLRIDCIMQWLCVHCRPTAEGGSTALLLQLRPHISIV
jgi:hypothetical protein